MSRYIDAEALLNRLPDDLPYKASVKRVLIQAPTADVVEVVRCKDCKYSNLCTNFIGREYLGCELIEFETVEVDPDHYCGYGMRRRSEEGGEK